MNIKNYLATVVLIALPISQQVHAEFLGALDGRSGELSETAELTVELNTNTTGDDYQWSGLRINYKASDSLIVYADVSKVGAEEIPINDTETEKFEGQAFGGGLVYNMPDLLSGYTTSLKGTYHTAKLPDKGDLTFNNAPTTVDHELTSMSGKMLISPEDALLDNGTSWYGSIGYSKIDGRLEGPISAKIDMTAGFTAAIGLVMPLSIGEAYVGIESIGGARIAVRVFVIPSEYGVVL